MVLPDASIAVPVGYCNDADVASPPSPLKLLVPVPAIVVMMFVDAETLRIR